MQVRNRPRGVSIRAAVVLIFLMAACGQSLNSKQTPGAVLPPAESITPTPTSTGSIGVEPTPIPNRCDGLSGELEMQILVGPADAVGLEPLSVGEIPFSIEPEGGVYLLQGSGAISYEATLEQAWGTYSVNLDMDGTLQGECGGELGSETLTITVEMSGEQMVEVRSEGFQGDYPWSGTQARELSFPLEDGATAEGEGWTFVLHLPK